VSFRRRLTLAAAAAAAGAFLVAAVVAYLVVRGELRGEVDSALRARAGKVADFVTGLPGGVPLEPPPGAAGRLGGPVGYVQLVGPDGTVARPPGARIALPVTARTRDLARNGGDSFLSDAHVAGSHVRILTQALPGGGTVQLARPLDEIDSVLARMRLILGLMLLLGVALALTLGRLVARAALRPVERLTEASEHVATTRDLSRRIDAAGTDELARLAASFNTMLDALERSVTALDASIVSQRRLVADASHELRTPLTSVRTNVDVLRDPNGLPEPERRRLADEVGIQIDELTVLVGDLIELARGDQPLAEPEDIRLDRLVEEAVERARRHAPGVQFRAVVEPTVVEGVPDRLERAVRNLLDNAAKFSPPGAAVDVTLRDGELAVRDRGPGIDPKEIALVFDRFYRSNYARGVPGSGLGLAIVRQVAESHGGEVEAASAPDGGSVFRLRLPEGG
jgi:two-component system sensor histidine kinase MprB